MSGRRGFFEMAGMKAHMIGSIAPMIEARAAHGFNAEEERCFRAMERISPKCGWPRNMERVRSIEDRNRAARYLQAI